MTERFSEELLERYLDGELDPATSAEVESALARVPELERRLAEKRAVRRLVRETLLAEAREEALEGMAEEVLARVAASHERGSHSLLDALRERLWPARTVWVPALGAALAALVVALWWPGRHGGGDAERRAQRSDGAAVVEARTVAEVRARAAPVEIDSLETGSRLAMVYEFEGSRTTVIWIADQGQENLGLRRHQ